MRNPESGFRFEVGFKHEAFELSHDPDTLGKIPRDPYEVLPYSNVVSLEVLDALRQVLGVFNLPIRVVANEGAPFPDGDARVPKGAAFVTYDTGNIPMDVVWRNVTAILPTPAVDGKR